MSTSNSADSSGGIIACAARLLTESYERGELQVALAVSGCFALSASCFALWRGRVQKKGITQAASSASASTYQQQTRNRSNNPMRRAASNIITVVFTGGPCGGKSTALEKVKKLLEQVELKSPKKNVKPKKKYNIFFAKECATMLVDGGLQFGRQPITETSVRKRQANIVNTQFALEEAFVTEAEHIYSDYVEDQMEKTTTLVSDPEENDGDDEEEGTQDPFSIVLCDRGTLDGRGYLDTAGWQWVLRYLGQSEKELCERYDLVLHFESVAASASKEINKKYTDENNAARWESLDEAATLDQRLVAAWGIHPKRQVVHATDDFDDKVQCAVDHIRTEIFAIRKTHRSILEEEKEDRNQNKNNDNRKNDDETKKAQMQQVQHENEEQEKKNQ